jgi:hypothetical protein
MIAVHRAVYREQTDSIEVAMVLHDDDGNSLSNQVKEVVVTLLHVENSMQSVTLNGNNVVKRFDEEDDNIVHDFGEYYVFFMHPAAQRHLSVKMEVETISGETMTAVTPIKVQRVLEPNENQNPAMPGRDIIEYPKTVDKP